MVEAAASGAGDCKAVKGMEESVRAEDDATMFALVKQLVPTFHHNANKE